MGASVVWTTGLRNPLMGADVDMRLPFRPGDGPRCSQVRCPAKRGGFDELDGRDDLPRQKRKRGPGWNPASVDWRRNGLEGDVQSHVDDAGTADGAGDGAEVGVGDDGAGAS